MILFEIPPSSAWWPLQKIQRSTKPHSHVILTYYLLTLNFSRILRLSRYMFMQIFINLSAATKAQLEKYCYTQDRKK